MKVKKIILLTLLAAVAFIAIYFLVKRTQNNRANINVFQAIPEEADGVAVINIEAFMKLFFTNIGDVWELRDENKDSGQAQKMEDEFRLSGINLSRKIAIYAEDEALNLIVPISDKEKFTNYIFNIRGKADLEEVAEDQYFSNDLGTFIGFNDQICYLRQSKRSDLEVTKAKWNGIQNSKEDDKQLSSDIEELANSDQHFSFFMKENEMAERSPFFNHSPSAKTSIVFEDGRILITSELKTENSSIVNPLVKGRYALQKGNYLDGHLSLNPESNMDYWLSDLGSERLMEFANTLGMDSSFISSWEGLMNLSITGLDIINKEHVTYVYDDDFNKVEQKQMTKSKQIGYTLSFNGARPEINMSGLELLGFGSGINSEMEGSYIISSKENPEFGTESSPHALSISLNPKNLIKLSMEQGFMLAMMGQPYAELFDEISLVSDPIGNDKIKSVLEIKTSDSDKNALIFLMGAMQRMI